MLRPIPVPGLVLSLAAFALAACGRPYYPPYHPGPIGPPPPVAPRADQVTPPPPPIDAIRPRIP